MGAWRVETISDTTAFLAGTHGHLARHEAANTVLLGRLRSLQHAAPGEVRLLAALRDGAVALAALVGPPHGLGQGLTLSLGEPGALGPLAKHLLDAGTAVPGVYGSSRLADAFSGTWTARAGGTAEVAMEMELLHLAAVPEGAGPAGALTAASEDELELVAGWRAAAVAEMSLPAVELEHNRNIAAAQVARGEIVLWQVKGEPVSMAGIVPTALDGRGGRIGLVYTPPQHRHRGHARACVTALTRRLLQDGWRYCLIFADRGNPVTRRLYRDIGYRPIGVFRQIAFAPGG